MSKSLSLDDHNHVLADLSAIAGDRESAMQQSVPSRRHPLAKVYAIETCVIAAVVLARDCMRGTFNTPLPDSENSPDSLWDFHRRALAWWSYCHAVLDAANEYVNFNASSPLITDVLLIACKSEIKCQGYPSFYDAAVDRIKSMRDMLKTLIASSSNRESFDYEQLWQGGEIVLNAFQDWEVHPSQVVSDHELINGVRFELSNAALLTRKFW